MERYSARHYFLQCDYCSAQTLHYLYSGENRRNILRAVEKDSVERGWVLIFDGGARHYCSQTCAARG